MWEKIVYDPKALASIYNDLPSLDGIQIKSIDITYDGPRLNMMMQLPKFPDKPSPRWPASAKCITVEIDFPFIGILLKKFGTQNFVTISSEAADDERFSDQEQLPEKERLYKISFKGNDFDLELYAYTGIIQRFHVN